MDQFQPEALESADSETRVEVARNCPRNSIIASLLSLFLPGLGQSYNGQSKKGMTLFLLTFILLIPVLLIFFRSIRGAAMSARFCRRSAGNHLPRKNDESGKVDSIHISRSIIL